MDHRNSFFIVLEPGKSKTQVPQTGCLGETQLPHRQHLLAVSSRGGRGLIYKGTNSFTRAPAS